MQFTITIDATAEEMRTFLGWPDVAPLQQDMLDRISERMKAGDAAFDPMALMQPYLAPNLQNLEAFQKAFWQSFSKASPGKTSED